MADEAKGIGFYTCVNPVTMIYPNLVEPKPFKNRKGEPTGEPKYSGEFLFAPDDAQVSDLKKLAAQVAKDRWGATVNLKELATPWKDGTKKAEQGWEKAQKAGKTEPYKQDEAGRGKVRIAARSKFRPRLSILQNGRIVELEDDAAVKKYAPTFFYPGALVLPEFNVVAYEGVRDDDPNGINIYLQQVFSIGKGEKLGNSGGRSAADTFSGYVGSHTDFDPTAGGAGIGVGDDDIFS